MPTVKDFLEDEKVCNDTTIVQIKWRKKGQTTIRTTVGTFIDDRVLCFMDCFVFWVKWDYDKNVLTLATRGQPYDWVKQDCDG